MFQIPSYMRGYRWNYAEHMDTEKRMEMHVLPQYKTYEIINANGCVPVEVAEYKCTGEEMHSLMYTVRKA